MASFARYLPLFTLLALNRVSDVSAQCTPNNCGEVPLFEKTFTWPNLPYQVDTEPTLNRGGQTGYNICNSTTQNQESLCQTSHFNSIDDFCLWAPPETGKTVGDIEGEMVAWCTKNGHGTRLIPDGAITGLQWIKTPDYVQAVGYLDQTMINLLPDDNGGEMDPFGLDLRGNPIGGLVYSTAFGGDNPTQVIRWHLFLGAGRFCFKACDPAGPNAHHYCENIYDRIGCDYNIPNAAKQDVFEVCEGENMDFVGTYTENGQVLTYTQPHEGVPTVPYTPRIPESSNCVTQTSANLFSGLPAPTAAPSASGSSSASAGPSAGPSSRLITANPSSSGPTGTAAPAETSEPGSARGLAVSLASVFGAALVGLVLA